MYKRILVAIDDSATSQKALDEAINLVKSNGAALLLCHALDESLLASAVSGLVALDNLQELEKGIKTHGETLVERAAERARAAGLTPETRLVESENEGVADLVVRCAEEWQADLIVVGSHGRRGVERFLVGSVAEKLVRKATTSLIIVRG
jgi:nucleotide-binding universal stress UspA family protein